LDGIAGECGENNSLKPQVRKARVVDAPVLVALMADFYKEAGYTLPHDAATRAFTTLLAKASRGRVWVVQVGIESVGYIALTLGFNMEYGGPRGFVDDLFVRPAMGGRGFGTAALETVRQTCRELGVRALLVETGPANHPARGVYTRAGFKESGRKLLAQALAAAIHEANKTHERVGAERRASL
jgi:GNAT superfamily N-acetyltransferase